MTFGIGGKVLFAHGPGQQQIQDKANQHDKQADRKVERVNAQRALGSITHRNIQSVACCGLALVVWRASPRLI